MKTLLLFLLFGIVKLEETLGDDKKDQKSESIKYTRPEITTEFVRFAEPFHSQDEFQASWVKSEAKKDGVDAAISKYDGVWTLKEPEENPMEGDQGMVFTSEAKHGAIASMLKDPFRFEDKPLIVQYEVKFQNKHECGGAYVKLLAETADLDIKQFTDKTLYSIMFGPDKCGSDGKLHFIFQHQNPITQKMEEKHAKAATGDFGYIFDDKKTHLVTLIVRPDNTFQVSVDNKKVNEGSLLTDVEPPVNPPKEIDDPSDVKPEDWDEREKIPDPDATKPDDWDENAPKTIPDPSATKPAGWLDDEPELISDPEAVRPEDWDDEEDGEWEAPQINNPNCKASGCGEWKAALIKNPDYKGKWTPPLINNPSYKGIWAPKKIENPDFFEDLNPFAMQPIAAVGFELWSMQADILFDNIIITDDESILNQWNLQTWELKHSKEVANTPSVVGSMLNDFLKAANEKPWLYAVAVFAILLPLVLFYIFCLSGNKEDNVSYKKTDAPQPDDSQPKDEDEGGDADENDKEADTDKEVDSDGDKVAEDGEETSSEKSADEKEEEEVDEVIVNKPEVSNTTPAEDTPVETTNVDTTEEKEEMESNVESEDKTSPRTRSRRKMRKE